MTVNFAAQAAWKNAIDQVGTCVTLRRVAGFAPNVTVLASVSVPAKVSNDLSDTTSAAQSGLSASSPGAIDQADRTVKLMASDLSASGFPLPVVNGDQVVLPDSTEILNVLRVDGYTLRYAGVIQFICAGVS